MSTLITPIRPPDFQRGPGRIVERTTTITREIFLDDPTPAQVQTQSQSQVSDDPIHGIDRALVRLGAWLINLGRRHALHPSAGTASATAARADEIARRVDDAKAHDMKHFIGFPY
ncbi:MULTISPECIES: hypothetical protein [unclassified Brevibacterium]|uniref:hypothetical protein n=1 Tax=unclassified Brevibacterium TaxID=2614124 RepID=UPI0018686B15|nr:MULTISPECIES: hypothetical protein [unclassified Brevibacterium]